MLNVVARRALALPDEAISCIWETASAKHERLAATFLIKFAKEKP